MVNSEGVASWEDKWVGVGWVGTSYMCGGLSIKIISLSWVSATSHKLPNIGSLSATSELVVWSSQGCQLIINIEICPVVLGVVDSYPIEHVSISSSDIPTH